MYILYDSGYARVLAVRPQAGESGGHGHKLIQLPRVVQQPRMHLVLPARIGGVGVSWGEGGSGARVEWRGRVGVD